VSDNWILRTNPKCKALMVDPDNCGLWRDVCGETESCVLGLCLPKSIEPCETDCGAGESCCWSLGVEECRDTEEDQFNCGGCGNVCPVGTVCWKGICIEWYHVFDVCPGDLVNCGAGGAIECKNLSTDNDNCGGCGLWCSDTGECQGGVCVDTMDMRAVVSDESE
jgi:hypothetical protein